MSTKDLEKIFEAYVCDSDVYEYAYANCAEYRNFIDNMNDDVKKKIRIAHTGWKVSNGAEKFREGLFHAGTFGLSFGIKKLMNIKKKSKKEMIIELVESDDFVNFFRALNLKQNGEIEND